MATKEERNLLASCSARAGKALEILRSFERDEIEITASLGRALDTVPLTLVVFACLGTRRGTEELKLDLGETIFLRKFRREAEILLQALNGSGVESELLILLPDMEPRRTWGWNVPQQDLTGYCRMMAEDGAATLPKRWSVLLWSDIERRMGLCDCIFEQSVRWAEESASPLVMREERQFFRELGKRHPDILTKNKPDALALRQIAAYAHEGKALELLFPTALLLQTDTPVHRKDAMFQPLRTEPLPIAHPFTR